MWRMTMSNLASSPALYGKQIGVQGANGKFGIRCVVYDKKKHTRRANWLEGGNSREFLEFGRTGSGVKSLYMCACIRCIPSVDFDRLWFYEAIFFSLDEGGDDTFYRWPTFHIFFQFNTRPHRKMIRGLWWQLF